VDETVQRSNVFLVGMPGSGKSTVGRLLAKSLGQRFVDSDEEIVRRNGVEISTIFEIEGEAGFRDREAAVINDVSQSASIVLATGGGSVLREANRQVLRARGLVVYLRASLDVLDARTEKKFGGGMSHKRPLLEGPNRRATLESLLAVREPLYEATAHIVIDANTTQRAKFMHKLLAAIEAARQAPPMS
jgi:shikimate kinase